MGRKFEARTYMQQMDLVMPRHTCVVLTGNTTGNGIRIFAVKFHNAVRGTSLCVETMGAEVSMCIHHGCNGPIENAQPYG